MKHVNTIWIAAAMVMIWPARVILQAACPAPDPRSAQTLIVPGTAQYDGRPSAQFAARLDQAADLWRANPSLRVITVGGNLPGDRFTEAGVGADQLRRAGVDPGAITAVAQGNDTRGSLAAALAACPDPGRVIIVTDPNHRSRARLIAREVGFSGVDTVGAAGTPTRFPGTHWAWTLLHESAGLAVADLRRLPAPAGVADMLEKALRTAAGRLRPSRSTRYRHLDRDGA
ncbi:YdcF family protein [Corynebacterium sp. CCM 8835]|uniref:YdcF family protein n=1 Tax=Corynebacterium antarcticum TaxID=2800405 RepID=UPI001F2F8CEE|nr:YdcF family protein [Corynebacterium antarcticum]MCK7641897.1 YdcF family protein [Corynebacterium antarcticum]MCK7659996.1 YdcF family protein [Corynebacterium antarcticum]MCL0245126.1 YdcF family protein [Corynebacterium antarcticum]MCX7539322.1 YdcF family protein [Corynebacterium antarcticum]